MNTPKKQMFVQAGDKYLIRFPEGMRDRIAASAKENSRSMNAEIIARIEYSFSGSAREEAIEEIKGLLDQQYRKAFEETVMASLERFKNELKNGANG
jgi:hypothetical protein